MALRIPSDSAASSEALRRIGLIESPSSVITASGKVSAPLYFNRGNAFKALGRYARSLASYDEALRIRPAYGAALTNKIEPITDMVLDSAVSADLDIKDFIPKVFFDTAVYIVLRGEERSRASDQELRVFFGDVMPGARRYDLMDIGGYMIERCGHACPE